MTAGMNIVTSMETVADLLHQLGGLDPTRVRIHPAPGTATEQDVLDIHTQEGRLCELVEQALVEKIMGFRESWLASFLIYSLLSFVRPRNLGVVTGEAGLIRLAPGLVRIPDVAFISWDRLPGRQLPPEPIPGVIPNLVIEVISAGNTASEMARKRREYFSVGVQLVWIVIPATRTVEVYTDVDQAIQLSEADSLDGGSVLPGFSLSIRELFHELDRQETKTS